MRIHIRQMKSETSDSSILPYVFERRSQEKNKGIPGVTIKTIPNGGDGLLWKGL